MHWYAYSGVVIAVRTYSIHTYSIHIPLLRPFTAINTVNITGHVLVRRYTVAQEVAQNNLSKLVELNKEVVKEAEKEVERTKKLKKKLKKKLSAKRSGKRS